jgi:gag-polypeptide of LTR copia-type
LVIGDTPLPRGTRSREAPAQSTNIDFEDNSHGIRAFVPVEETKTILFRQEPNKCVFRLENGKDYYPWQYSMMKFFVGEGLAAFVTGDSKKPELSGLLDTSEYKESEKRYLKWAEANMAAERAILACIGKNQITLVARCKSAAEMWTRLKDTYLQKDDSNILRLERELKTVEWRRDMTLEQYIQQIIDLVEQLRLCGHDVPDRQVKLHLLEGLPPKMSNFKDILLHDKSQTFDETCDSIRSHVGYHKKVELERHESSSSSAYLGRRNNKRNMKGKSCIHCKKDNHSSDECYFKNKDKPDFSKIKCHRCRKMGHYA